MSGVGPEFRRCPAEMLVRVPRERAAPDVDRVCVPIVVVCRWTGLTMTPKQGGPCNTTTINECQP